MIEIAKHQIIKSNDTQRSIEQLKIYDFCNERAKNESIQKFAIFFLTKSLTKSCVVSKETTFTTGAVHGKRLKNNGKEHVTYGVAIGISRGGERRVWNINFNGWLLPFRCTVYQKWSRICVPSFKPPPSDPRPR